MSLALALAIVLGGSGLPLPAVQDESLSGLVRQACVDTGMRRDAFEALGQARRWTSSTPRHVSGETAQWSSAFRSGRAVIFMSGTTGEGVSDPSLAASCTVSVTRPDRDWQADIVALASELELQAEPDPEIPGTEMQTWAKPMGHRLTSVYQSANRTASVTLSRPIVIRTQ